MLLLIFLQILPIWDFQLRLELIRIPRYLTDEEQGILLLLIVNTKLLPIFR
jgi:hypothetical protein